MVQTTGEPKQTMNNKPQIINLLLFTAPFSPKTVQSSNFKVPPSRFHKEENEAK
jgi:hypothetical protein